MVASKRKNWSAVLDSSIAVLNEWAAHNKLALPFKHIKATNLSLQKNSSTCGREEERFCHHQTAATETKKKTRDKQRLTSQRMQSEINKKTNTINGSDGTGRKGIGK